MKLSIIIPTFDSLDTLKVLVKQIYKYTKGDFRVYIIEDGHNLKTRRWLYSSSIDKKGNLHPIYHNENKGVAVSWNDGLKWAVAHHNADYFAILNDDIELCPDWWEKCQQMFSFENVHMVCLDAPCPLPLTGWFFILDKVALKKVGYFDEQFAPYTSEDADYFYRYKASGLKWAKIKLDIFHHGSKTINKIKEGDILKYKEVWNENWKRLKHKHPSIKHDNTI